MVMNLSNYEWEYKQSLKNILKGVSKATEQDIELILDSDMLEFTRVDESIYVKNYYTQSEYEFLTTEGNKHLTKTFINSQNNLTFQMLLKEAIRTKAVTYERYAKHSKIIKLFNDVQEYNLGKGVNLEELRKHLKFDIEDKNTLKVLVEIYEKGLSGENNEDDGNDEELDDSKIITFAECFKFDNLIFNKDHYSSYVRFIYHFLMNTELQKDIFEIKDFVESNENMTFAVNKNGIYNYYTNINNLGLKVNLPLTILYNNKHYKIQYVYKNKDIYKKYVTVTHNNKIYSKEITTYDELVEFDKHLPN